LRTFSRLSRNGSGASRMLVDAPTWMRSMQVAQAASDDFEWLEIGAGVAESHELALLQRVYA